MKERRKIRIGLLTVLLLLTFSCMSTQAASNKSKAMKAYSRFLERESYYGKERTWSMDKFAIVDIDRNGTPELITMDSSFRPINVFTYKKGRVQCVREWAGTVWESDRKGYYIRYNASQKAIATAEHSGTGMWGYQLSQMKSGKLSNTFEINQSLYYDGDGRKITDCSYTKKKIMRTCSYKTYKTYEKKYFTNAKVKKVYFVENTKGNRKKKLK